MNSRAKGCRGERELAAYLTGKGHPSHRGQQFAGGHDSPDVICESLDNFHLECKRTERLNLYAAMDQAIRDADQKTPVVAHRRNRGEWLAIIRLDDLLNLIRRCDTLSQ